MNLLGHLDFTGQETQEGANVLIRELPLAAVWLGEGDLRVDRAQGCVRMHDDLVRAQREERRSAEGHERNQDRHVVESLSDYGHQLPGSQSVSTRTVDEDIDLLGAL